MPSRRRWRTALPIQKAVDSLEGTAAERMAKIEQAISSQTTTLSSKLAAIEAAVKSGASDDAAALEAIKTAIETSGTTTAEKLAALEQAISGQTTSLTTKLAAIETAVTGGVTDVTAALALIKTAVEAIPAALTSLDTDLSTKIAEVVTAIGAVNTTLTTGDVATALSNILDAITNQTDYTDILESILENVEALGGTTIHGHRFVEMGDGLKWATMNVGATTPEEFGDYFAWGETEPKNSFSWDNYKYGTEDNLTKYNASDGKVTLDLSDDAASANWKGTWRMPKRAEWAALCNTTNYTWTYDSDKGGYTVTSKVSGYEGNSIFIPAGSWFGGPGVGEYGYYWSSEMFTATYNHSYILFVGPTEWETRAALRYVGYSVRAVSD